MKLPASCLVGCFAVQVASPAAAQMSPTPESTRSGLAGDTTRSTRRTDVTLGFGLHNVDVSGYAVMLPSVDLEVRRVKASGQGALVRLWMSTVGGYGFGAVDLGYIYQVPLLGSKDMGMMLDLIAGPTIADAEGCDMYDDYISEDGNDCAGPNLNGTQLGGFFSPSLSIRLGHFTTHISPIYRFLRQRGDDEKRDTSFKGLMVGIGLGAY